MHDKYYYEDDIRLYRRYTLAERVGFEPTVEKTSTTDFESAPFDRSGISPLVDIVSHVIFLSKVLLYVAVKKIISIKDHLFMFNNINLLTTS